MPRSLGGLNNPENLVVACPPCNMRKGSDTQRLVDAVMALRRRREQADERLERAGVYIEFLKVELLALGGDVDPPRDPGIRPRRPPVGKCRTCGSLHLPGQPRICTLEPEDEMRLVELGRRVAASLRGENRGPGHRRRGQIGSRAWAARRRAKGLDNRLALGL